MVNIAGDLFFSDVPERVARRPPRRDGSTSSTHRKHFAKQIQLRLTLGEKLPLSVNLHHLGRTDNPVIVRTAQIFTTPKRQHK